MSKEELDKLMFIKENDVIKPLYKLLVLLKLGYTNSQILKDILGGNYIVLIKEASLRGLVQYKKGEQVRLTRKGEHLASLVFDFLEKIRNEGEKGG